MTKDSFIVEDIRRVRRTISERFAHDMEHSSEPPPNIGKVTGHEV